ncbi:MAG: DUF6817 domain-containing protein [Actinomycetota bacterium]
MNDDVRPAPPTGARLDLLRRLGYHSLTHDSHVPFLSHLVGTRRILVGWGERPALCDAGLFHSAYGTEYFRPDVVPDQDELQSLIGVEAETIARAWCTIRRDTIGLDEPHPAVVRDSDDVWPLGRQLAGDIATLWAADTVEQIDRMSPGDRGFAHGLPRVLHLASPAAQQAAQPWVTLLDA